MRKTPTNTTSRPQNLDLTSPASPGNSFSTLRNKRARHTNSPSSDEMNQPLGDQTAANEIHDSDGLSLSTTISLEDQSGLGCISHYPRKLSTRGKSLSQPHPPDEALDEEIISTALIYPCIKRHELLPQVFDKQGRMPSRWNFLRPRIDAAKEEQKRQPVANKKVQPLLEAPLGIPKRFTIPPALQSVEETTEHVTAEELRISFQGEDAGVVSHTQLSVPDEPIDHILCDRRAESSQANSRLLTLRLPKMGSFSTQSGRTSSNLKTYGQGRNQSLKAAAPKVQKGTGNGHPGRILRSGLSVKSSDIQSLSAINITPQQSNAEQFLSLNPAELSSPSDTTTPSALKDIEKSPVADTITVDSSKGPRQMSPPPLSSEADLVLAPPSAREQETATRLLYGRVQQVQQNLSRNSKSCRNSHQKRCSCNPTHQPLEEINCSDIACYKKWWGVDDLWKQCGIKLSDAQESKRRFNCWFCPQCSNKARVLLQSGQTGSSSPPISCSPATLIREGFSNSGGPDDGSWPEDGEVRGPLQHLTGMMQQYTGNTTMARNKLSPISPQTRILDIPCIRDETLNQSAGRANHAIGVIRNLLDVPEGVLVKHKIEEVKLQDMTCQIWIRGILSFFVSAFVFDSGSPFEDVVLWKKILADGKTPISRTSFRNIY
jgi:hypothetical protein